MGKEQHVHVWVRSNTAIPVRRVIKEKGQPTRDVMTAKDTLKQWKCKCGAIQTFDLERTSV